MVFFPRWRKKKKSKKEGHVYESLEKEQIKIITQNDINYVTCDNNVNLLSVDLFSSAKFTTLILLTMITVYSNLECNIYV